jgi:hypothetical protein
MLKRHLEQVLAIDQWSFQQLIRDAAERGLIAAVEPWIEFRDRLPALDRRFGRVTARPLDGEAARRGRGGTSPSRRAVRGTQD